MTKIVKPGVLRGDFRIPGSKSHTIRALLIASLAKGKSRLISPLASGDTISCLLACQKLGAEIVQLSGSAGKQLSGRAGEIVWEVKGTGGAIRPADSRIDAGNSGTTLYLASCLAALGDAEIEFTGDEQIQSRPAEELLSSLEDLGARVVRKNSAGRGCAPYSIRGPLTGGTTEISCPTSQYLSGLLLAAPLIRAAGPAGLPGSPGPAGPPETVIRVPLLNEKPYVEMTLSWLAEQGIVLENRDFKEFRIPGGQSYRGFEKAIPGDFSSAAFFFAAAAITGGEVTLRGLDWEDPQADKAVVTFLEEAGCRTEIRPGAVYLSRDPGTPLRGITMNLNDAPDSLPALAAAACYAAGETRITGTAHARLKETDRIAVMAAELSKMGADIKETPDGLVIRGTGGAPLRGVLPGPVLEGHGDHRVVMALACAALGAAGESPITGAEAAGVTFPEFFSLLENSTL